MGSRLSFGEHWAGVQRRSGQMGMAWRQISTGPSRTASGTGGGSGIYLCAPRVRSCLRKVGSASELSLKIAGGGLYKEARVRALVFILVPHLHTDSSQRRAPGHPISRLPTAVPSSPNTLPSRLDPVAISAHKNNYISYTSQDVHLLVNNSTSFPSSSAPRIFGQAPPLETSVSSSAQPLTQHVINHPIRRPRTSYPVFQSSKDLAAHHGIPQVLPPAPRIAPTVQQHIQHKQTPQSLPLLRDNYLQMLRNTPTESSTMVEQHSSTTISPTDLEAPVVPSEPSAATQQNFDDFFASPEFNDNPDFMDLFTPNMPTLDNFDTSPFETPYSDFLSTPLFADEDMLTSPSLAYNDDRPLFGGIDLSKHEEVPVKAAPSVPTQITPIEQDLYTISPNLESPFLDFDAMPSFNAPGFAHPSSLTSVASQSTSDADHARRTKATGIRKGITPDALLGDDAPIQPRKYVTPSATSRKAVPASVKKRKRVDDLDEEELDEKDVESVVAKRTQNTLAARRSRRRKLEAYQQAVKDSKHRERISNIWKTRALTMQAQLKAMGIYTYDYQEDEEFPRLEDEL